LVNGTSSTAVLPTKFQELLTNTELLGLNRRDGLSSDEYQRLQNSPNRVTKLCEQLAKFDLAYQLSAIPSALRWLPVLSRMDATTRNKYIEAIPNLMREFLCTTQFENIP
jgi:hypothetical protein